MYQVRRVNIGKSRQLDELAHACGELYSKTLVFFWRTVRHKGKWLKAKHLMRLFPSEKLHAHTADACVQAFFAALKSWRELRKTDPKAKPPRKRKWYFRVEYKRSALQLKDGILRLSNGKGNEPLRLNWPWELPQTVGIHWTGTEYEALATYRLEEVQVQSQGNKVAGIDLGEIHMAVSHDGEHTHILNGRLLRSKRQYRNKVQAKLNSRIDGRMKKGSRRRKKLIRLKKKQLRKLKRQIQDIEHKQTTRLVCMLYQEGVHTVAIGDVRDIRQDMDVGSKNNQQLHQWSHGSIRHKLTYKAERLGMQVCLQEESYTSKTCPACKHRRKSPVQGRTFRCGNCGFCYHRDGVGAITIRAKYQGNFGSLVVGALAPPTGMRFRSHTRVARWENLSQREAAPL